jgi:Prokaryotic membrane lipoprotein lipid attachment site
MKKILISLVILVLLTACNAQKKGCGMQNGAVDAKRIAEGDPKAIKASKKLKKFKY